ncbi:ABC transporter ATP-binding protein [Streptomyces sp. NPDC002643]
MSEAPRADAGPDATEAAGGVAVRVEGFGLAGSRGRVFRGVGFEAGPGDLVVVEGASGSGRTSLLLALTGRMKPSEGHASIGSLRLPKQMAAVRRISALAHVPGVTDLEPALTVAEHLRERALLQRRFDGSLRGLLRSRRERAAETGLRIDTALAAAGLDLGSLPKGARTAVRDLDRMEALRLSVALALVGRPRLLGVDDADLKLSDAERAEMWALLKSVAESGVTVVAVCGEAPAEAAVVVSTGSEEAARAREGTSLAWPRAETGEGDGDSDGSDPDDDKETADAFAGTGRP